MLHQVKMLTLKLAVFTLCSLNFVTSTLNHTELASLFLESLGSASLGQLLEGRSINSSLSAECFNNNTALRSCLVTQCISGEEVARLYQMSLDTQLDDRTVREVAPAVLYTVTQRSTCFSAEATDHHNNDTFVKRRPSSAGVWGYSFLFVTLINLCSLTGILVLPCMKSDMYKVILMFMVALAVGTLVGSGVLILIPEAFELTHVGGGGSPEEKEASSNYLSTASSIVGGIYLFFLIERIMRMINTRREKTKELKRRDKLATRGSITSSFTRKTPHNASLKLKDPSHLHFDSPSSNCLCTFKVEEDASEESGTSDRNCRDFDSVAPVMTDDGDSDRKADDSERNDNKDGKLLNGRSSHSHHGHSHGTGDDQVAPVAYMVIFGDGLHNFIDGLSIGAAFTDSILLGISVSVAVMCEELPHELGDFAILLNAGMRLRKALMYNFMSSLMCYGGLVIGILVGENTTAHTWIFGLAGGMFLYISLVDMVFVNVMTKILRDALVYGHTGFQKSLRDYLVVKALKGLMMPEMNSTAESADGKRFGLFKTFLVQNVGLLSGYCLILLMAMYGGEINFE